MGKKDLYLDNQARELPLETIKSMMRAHGATGLYVKFLSPNDNAKNQPYLGPDLSSLSHIPSGDVVAEKTTSSKPGAEGKWRLKAPLTFFWLTPEGTPVHAPNAQIIYYPQYPEARLSGFSQGAEAAPSSLMDPKRRGREHGRVLLLGTTDDKRVLAWLGTHDSAAASELAANPPDAEAGVFHRLSLAASVSEDREQLLKELCRIHSKDWIPGCRYKKHRGAWAVMPYKAQNAGGYTLEAELGITPNGYAEPDYLGWEVKQFATGDISRLRSLGALTLMTPEPDAGFYGEEGVEKFVRAYGYPDKRGREDRLNFGGTHYYGKQHSETRLKLDLPGFDPASGKIIDLASGGVALTTDDDEIAALWSFPKLIDHWKRKHGRAVFVPAEKDASVSPAAYRFGRNAFLAEGTDFLMLVRAIVSGQVYYDPGIKLEAASQGKSSTKARSQFRIRVKQIPCLYKNVQQVDCCHASVIHNHLSHIG